MARVLKLREQNGEVVSFGVLTPHTRILTAEGFHLVPGTHGLDHNPLKESAKNTKWIIETADVRTFLVRTFLGRITFRY